MARDLSALLAAMGVSPALAVGHSAGAAILARMCLDGLVSPAGLVSLNGAFLPLGGSAGQWFAPLARVMAGLPVLPQVFAWRARDRRVVERLLAGTGSRLDAAGVALYARVVGNADHAGAALRMMAHWDLAPLVRDLPALRVPLMLVVGAQDRAIPPGDAARVAAMVAGASVVSMPGLGHLSHEEDAAGGGGSYRRVCAADRGVGVSRLFASGRIMDWIIAATVLEGCGLVALHALTGRFVRPVMFVPNLISGLFLMVALRIALGSGWWGWIALALLGALVCHLCDLARLSQPKS